MNRKLLIPFFVLFFHFFQYNISAQPVSKNQISLQIVDYTGGGGNFRLLGVFADQNFVADTSSMSATGYVHFERKSGAPYKPGLYFLVLPDRNNVTVLLTETDQNVTLRTRASDLVGAMEVTGSPENELFFEFQRYQNQLEQQYNMLGQQLRSETNPQKAEMLAAQQSQLLEQRDQRIAELPSKYPNLFFPKFKIAGQNPKLPNFRKPNGNLDTLATAHYFRIHFWDGFDFSDGRLMRTPVFMNKMKRFMKDLTLQKPDSVIISTDFLLQKTLINKELFEFSANWIAIQYKPAKATMMDAERVYMHVVENYFTPERAFWSTAEELKNLREDFPKMRASLLGNLGQNVWGTAENGTRYALHDIKSQLKIVYIYSPDCEHCQEETPKLAAFYNEWRSRGVEIFSIASMAEVGKWKDFRKKYGVNWAQDVIDPQLESQYHMKYHIDITPEIYLLDKNNIIIAKNLKPEQLAEVCEKALSK
jgi:thiol-disulfide isomerase/thioredoxin